jgi:hypothetical protein
MLPHARQRPRSYFALQILSLTWISLPPLTLFPLPYQQKWEVAKITAVAEIVRLRNIAWEAIGTATVDGTKRAWYWRVWTMHCQLYKSVVGCQPSAKDATDRLLMFAVTMQEEKYGLGNQVKVQSVERDLQHVAQKLVLDGHSDPRRASPAQHTLDLPIAWIIKKFRDEDPPAQPKLAIPVSTITALSKNYIWTPHLDAVADLKFIAFFYLLHVGEYTTPSPPKGQPPRAKRTIALRDCDIWMWREGVLIPHSAGLPMLLTADSATVCIANTKNGMKGAVVHHDAGGPICPVAALAQRLANIQQAKSLRCRINSVFPPAGRRLTLVSDRDIGMAIQWGATFDCLLMHGYTLDRISSHSLQSGGAMAMKLGGASDSTIMQVGQWLSLAYLTYIHSQIGALTAGLSKLMAKQWTFQNMG